MSRLHMTLILSLTVLIRLLGSCTTLMGNTNGSFQADGIPSYYSGEINSAIAKIGKEIKGADGFIYFTDTHVDANKCISPYVIKRLLNNTPINKVVWGGDAITTYGNDIEEQWKKQCIWFDVLPYSTLLFTVHGNHDISIIDKQSGIRNTFSQERMSSLIHGYIKANVVRNEDDPLGCYYYYDDEENLIRFVFVDTNDRIDEQPDGSFAIGTGVGEVQLKWLKECALYSTPNDYRVIIISHIPISDTTGSSSVTFRKLKEMIDRAKQDGVEIVMYLSGHHHHDMQTYQNGILHVITASDASYQDYLRDPFAISADRHKRSVDEQCLDCFIVKDDSINVVRVGVGGDRNFHLSPVHIGVGDEAKFHTGLGPVEWFSYNAAGNIYSNSKWTLYNDIISVRNGKVHGLKAGNAVLLCQDALGNREIWSVIVE